jgi:hypothetical protein
MKKNIDLPTILDRIDDQLDYFYALFDLMGRASEKTDLSTNVSIEIIAKDASKRVVEFKSFIEKSRSEC